MAVIFDFAPADRVRVRTIHTVIAVAFTCGRAVCVSRVAPVWVLVVEAELPAPAVATSYYSSGDLYLFDDFQVSTPPETRRPDCETLLDVFTNIAIDEGEHVKTMQACQDYARIGARVVSPHMDGAHAAESREKWVRWAAEVNEAAKH